MKFPVRFKFFWLQQVEFMHDKNRFRSQLGITFAHACRINSPHADRKKDPSLGSCKPCPAPSVLVLRLLICHQEIITNSPLVGRRLGQTIVAVLTNLVTSFLLQVYVFLAFFLANSAISMVETSSCCRYAPVTLQAQARQITKRAAKCTLR